MTTDFTVRELRANGMTEAEAIQVHNTYVERLRRVYRAGVSVAFGTDIMVDVKGTTRGQLAAEYIDSFVEAGIPAKAILRAMTVNAYQLLGIDKERGSIKVGQFADLIAMPRNPLEDIQALQSITFVMKYGAVVKSIDSGKP